MRPPRDAELRGEGCGGGGGGRRRRRRRGTGSAAHMRGYRRRLRPSAGCGVGKGLRGGTAALCCTPPTPPPRTHTSPGPAPHRAPTPRMEPGQLCSCSPTASSPPNPAPRNSAPPSPAPPNPAPGNPAPPNPAPRNPAPPNPSIMATSSPKRLNPAPRGWEHPAPLNLHPKDLSTPKIPYTRMEAPPNSHILHPVNVNAPHPQTPAPRGSERPRTPHP